MNTNACNPSQYLVFKLFDTKQRTISTRLSMVTTAGLSGCVCLCLCVFFIWSQRGVWVNEEEESEQKFMDAYSVISLPGLEGRRVKGLKMRNEGQRDIRDSQIPRGSTGSQTVEDVGGGNERQEGEHEGVSVRTSLSASFPQGRRGSGRTRVRKKE